MVRVFVSIFFMVFSIGLFAQDIPDSLIVNLDLDEITVFEEYNFKNKREERKYQQLEEDLRILYPLVLIIRTEYKRINSELEAFYGAEQEKEFLKWYENYAKESYMHHLSVLNVRQGRLFLKLVARELDKSPYQIIKQYRNGFRAVMWQGAARLFFANLRTDYKPEKHPMIEHIMLRLESENGNL